MPVRKRPEDASILTALADYFRSRALMFESNDRVFDGTSGTDRARAICRRIAAGKAVQVHGYELEFILIDLDATIGAGYKHALPAAEYTVAPNGSYEPAGAS